MVESLYDNPWNMRAYSRDDFIVYRPYKGSQMISRNDFLSFLSYEYSFLLQFDSWDVCDIDHDEIHGHPTTQRSSAPSDEHMGGVRKAASIPVGITDRDDSQEGFPVCPVSATVADKRTLGELLDLGNPCLP